MKKYPNEKIDSKTFKFWEYKIIVQDEETKKEMMEAFKHIHHSDIDTDYVMVNQLAHEYLEGLNIDVEEEINENK